MRKILLISASLVLFFLPAGADGASDSLWIPQKMIVGETYEGVVILDDATPSGQIIVLSTSDPTIVSIQGSASILPYQNHGIFKMKTLRNGVVQIFAAFNGQIVSSQTEVYSSSMVPDSLSLLLPANKTKAEAILGYVISVDARGAPAPVVKDTQVTLRSSPMIKTDNSVLIGKGSHYAKFHAKVMGSGKIFATAEGLRPGQGQITKLQDDVTVRVKSAPDIILENSKAYFYVWLEKDGKPFKPPHVVHAFMSSSNLDSIRFNENPHIKQHSDAVLRISLVDGVGSGVLISSEPGSAVITADVEGFGSSQTDVIVGPATTDENFVFIEREDRDKVKNIEKKRPNIAIIWAYPATTDSKASGVIGLYNMNSTKTATADVESNGTSVLIASSIKRIEPVPIDGRSVTITSTGLGHKSVIKLAESNEVLMRRGIGSNHAIEFPITGNGYGDHIITASGPGLERFQTTLQVRPTYSESYRIEVVPIPSMPDTMQDIAMISILDSSDALVDTRKVFGDRLRISAVIGQDETRNIAVGSQNSAILVGSIGGITRVVVSADGIGPHEHVLGPSRVTDSISLEIPQLIHVLEDAPYAIHEVDSFGAPLRRINFTGVSTTPGITLDGNRVRIDDAGTEDLVVLSRLGVDNKQIEAFANHMTLQITPHGITNRVNKDFKLTTSSDVQDIQILIDSPFPYKKTGDFEYSITPDKEGLFNITFTGLKDGYAPARSVFSVHAERIFNVFVKAYDSAKEELHVNSVITIDGIAKNLVTPYSQESRPQFLGVRFPEAFEADENGYRLEYVDFGDKRSADGTIEQTFVDSDMVISAQYQKMIRIQAENADGSGYYPYGSTVTLIVTPKDKVSFFIRDVFDHWEGLPHRTDVVVLNATENIYARAVLREDYSFLMLAVGAALSVIVYFRFALRGGLDPLWYVRRATNAIRVSKVWLFLSALKKQVGMSRSQQNHLNKTEADFADRDWRF